MKYIYFILCFTCLNLSAQEVRYKISGSVHNDSIPIENVHIINKTSKRGVISNKNGAFKILVKISDTLTFSNIQFNNKIIIIKKSHILNNLISVNLFHKNNKLKEIVVKYPRNMSKSLNLPNADKVPLNKLERNLNAYSQKSTPMVILDAFLLSPILNSIPFLTPREGGIDDIYNIISGNRKRDKKLKFLLETDKLSEINYAVILQIRDHFQDDFFIETIHIPQENILDFIKFCEPKGIIYLFNKKRYMEVIDIFVKNNTAYLNTLNKLDE